MKFSTLVLNETEIDIGYRNVNLLKSPLNSCCWLGSRAPTLLGGGTQRGVPLSLFFLCKDPRQQHIYFEMADRRSSLTCNKDRRGWSRFFCCGCYRRRRTGDVDRAPFSLIESIYLGSVVQFSSAGGKISPPGLTEKLISLLATGVDSVIPHLNGRQW